MSDTKQNDEGRVNTVTKRTRYPYVWVSARRTEVSERFLPPVVDTAAEEDEDRSAPVVNTSTTGVRYPHIWVSARGKKIVECSPPVIDTEDDDSSVPVINTATEGVRYPHVWVSTTGPKMPERLPPVLVTVREGIRSVWSP